MPSDISYLKLINPYTKESLILSPCLGGTITTLKLGDKLTDILASDSDDEMKTNPFYRGRFLFPFNDRIPYGRYSFQGVKYQLPVNCDDDGSAIHGFLYNKKISILKITETETTLYWRSEKNKIQGYPFDVSLQINIKLHNGGVNLSFSVKNHGDNSAPYALGWHSYFKTDMSSVLSADYPSYFETDESSLPVGESISVTETLFDFRTGSEFAFKTLDHTFIAPCDGNSILTTKDYTIRIEQNNFSFTQLFIPPDRESIALEPISSKPNSFNTDDVLVLEPGKEYLSSIRIDMI